MILWDLSAGISAVEENLVEVVAGKLAVGEDPHAPNICTQQSSEVLNTGSICSLQNQVSYLEPLRIPLELQDISLLFF